MKNFIARKRRPISCGLVDSMPPKVTAWVAVEGDGWDAFGRFVAATRSFEDAQMIAEALNQWEKNNHGQP